MAFPGSWNESKDLNPDNNGIGLKDHPKVSRVVTQRMNMVCSPNIIFTSSNTY